MTNTVPAPLALRNLIESNNQLLKIYQSELTAKVAQSLARALAAAYAVAPDVVKIYDGCYNNRPMRGGSLPSLHARGAAIDLDAGNNGNLVSWPVRATMPLEVMICFFVLTKQQVQPKLNK